MELLYTLPVAILVLLELIRLRKDIIFKESKLKKEHEEQLAKERIEWENERCELDDFKKEHNKYVKLVYNNFNAILQLLGGEKVNKPGFHSKTIVLKIEELKKENRKLNLSNRSLKGANTKHKSTIKELEERIEAMVLDREGSIERMKDQADTIKRLINKKGK